MSGGETARAAPQTREFYLRDKAFTLRTLIVHNTVSGPRSDDVFAFQRALLRPGDEVVMRATLPGDDVEGLVGDARSFDAVVASGGDGTVASVAYVMRNSGVPVLVFPSGTANLLANNIGNSADPPALAQALRDGRYRDLDICEFEYRDLDGKPHRRGFLNMAGAGYDANIMQGSTGLKALFGPFSYYLAALGNLNPGTSRFKLSIDGETVEAEGICVLVANWATINQTAEFIPGTSPVDGLLDVAIMSAKNSVELLPAVFSSVFARGNESAFPNISFRHGREVAVECDPAFPMQYDGEVVENATTPFVARVIPKSFRVIVDPLSHLASLEA